MAGPVPTEVVEAAVQVCGTAFHYKAQLRAVLVGCGVPGELYDRWALDGANKYAIARHVLTDLQGRGPGGHDIARRVVVELANMIRPHPAAPDQDSGRRAITDLRTLATARRVLVDPEDAQRQTRRKEQERRTEAATARQHALAGISGRLATLASSTKSQQRRGLRPRMSSRRPVPRP